MAAFKSQLNILLADDDEDDYQLVEQAIKEALPKVHVYYVADGVELMNHLNQCALKVNEAQFPCPDLILLDLNMPRTDGREALSLIKSDERLKSIPVVILTTSNAPNDVSLAYRLGANSYLTKPSSYGELVRLMAVLGTYWFNAVELPVDHLSPSCDLPVKPKVKTTVLVVDDSSFARKVLNKILHMAGHKVLEAVDGETAIDLYRKEKPDLVLLDLVLSNFSGREVLQKLREIDPTVKVIITTTDFRAITSEELIGRGAIGLLYKPFGSEATLDSVDAALSEPPADAMD